MEYLREFKVTFYSDSNIASSTKEFDLEDYEDVEEMLEDIENVIKIIKSKGVLRAF